MVVGHMNLSGNRAARVFVVAACGWEAAQVATNGPLTWTAMSRHLRRTGPGRAVLVAFCGLLSYHLVWEGRERPAGP